MKMLIMRGITSPTAAAGNLRSLLPPPPPHHLPHQRAGDPTRSTLLSTWGTSRLIRSDCSSLQTAEGKVTGTPFPSVDSLKAVLFDVDGTLCDSDPLHFIAFQEMLQEVGFQGGRPITEEFFINELSGGDNFYLGLKLFPDWTQAQRDQFLIDKEARFRSFAKEKMKPVEGLNRLCNWIEKKGLRRAAVTNAPRPNAELLIALLGLESFFEMVIVGSECDRAKPFPDPYQKALKQFGVQPNQAFVLEDSSTGVSAAVAAGIPVVGVATRNPKDSLLQVGATLVINDYLDQQLWDALGTCA